MPNQKKNTKDNARKSKNKIVMIIILLIIIVALLIITRIFAITKKFENKLQEVKEATVVDVTELVMGEEIEHEHIYEKKYDNTKHWEECIVCGTKRNQVNHTYTDNGWTYGTEDNCKSNNVHMFSCNCGYSYTNITGRKAHSPNSEYYDASLFMCYADCKICKEKLSYHFCYDSDGKRIGCTNLKKCVICGNQARFNAHVVGNFTIGDSKDIVGDIIPNENTNLKCNYCDTNFCNVTVNYNYIEQISDNVFKFYVRITTPENAIFKKTDSIYNAFGTSATISDVKVTNPVQKNIWDYEATITFNKHIETSSIVGIRSSTTMNGYLTYIWLFSKPFNADTIAPKIDIVSQSSLDEWSKNKIITVYGSENYCNSVSLKILDNKENIVYNGNGTVTNGKYSITCTPNIEADEIGKTFKAIVTDACGNSTEKDFTVSKIDRVAPEPVSGTEILGDWAKSKEFTFSATDYGIGNVSIGFNDVVDYKLATKNGTEYTRDYKFIGDVYEPTNARVFYKDELGNLKTQTITIDKLDNTAPTITNVKLNKNKLSITSNDNHSELGEGSGVAKYKYITSENKLENVETLEDSTEVAVDEELILDNINEIKYVYIVAEDRAGNVSEVYELEIPGLELTTEVDLIGENGKGIIKLDWSTYDTENKVFKVYRKKEGQAEWEIIKTVDSNGEMIDNLAGDLKASNILEITANGIKEENKIKISYNAKDKGSTYSYYIEAYDKEDESLHFATSNEKEETVVTGIKGYYYVIDETNENIDFDISTGTYIEDESIMLELAENGKYIHMKAIDVAGNIGEEKVLEIGVKSKQVINLDGGKLNGESNPDLEAGLVGGKIDLEIPEKEGYTFDKWEVTAGSINGTEYTYGIEDGEITAKWIKNSYDYKVEYYYNGVKDEKETEIGNSEYESQIGEYTDKVKVGYKFDRVENIPLKITTNVENNVIKVYYVTDENQTKELSYTVEYYKENEKVEEDTQIEKKTVQVLEEDILNVDVSKINIVDKYRGYKIDRTEPVNIPSRIENGGVIKVYYVRKIANIEVKYIDEVTREEIEEKEVITGIEGDSYESKEKEIDGYELVEVPINTRGEMKEGTITIEYKYRKLSKVTVKHVDLNDNTEIEKIEKTYKEGDNYTTDSKEINGYKLVETSENTNGMVEREDIEVIYGYKKISEGVVVKHIDKETNEVIKEEKISGLVGEKYSTKKLDLEKYNFVEVVGNIEGYLTEESIEIVYYYEKKEAIVEIIYEDENGKEIYKEILEGKVGDKYKVEVKEIENYKIVEEPENIEGIYGVDEIVVKFVVEKIKSKVIINIVDEKGNIIEVIEKEGYVGDKEEIELPEIDGYYTEDKSIVIEYGKENNINITYKKKLFDLPNTSDINIYLYMAIMVISAISIVIYSKYFSKNR